MTNRNDGPDAGDQEKFEQVVTNGLGNMVAAVKKVHGEFIERILENPAQAPKLFREHFTAVREAAGGIAWEGFVGGPAPEFLAPILSELAGAYAAFPLAARVGTLRAVLVELDRINSAYCQNILKTVRHPTLFTDVWLNRCVYYPSNEEERNELASAEYQSAPWERPTVWEDLLKAQSEESFLFTLTALHRDGKGPLHGVQAALEHADAARLESFLTSAAAYCLARAKGKDGSYDRETLTAAILEFQEPVREPLRKTAETLREKIGKMEKFTDGTHGAPMYVTPLPQDDAETDS